MNDHVPLPVSSDTPVWEPSRQACPECGGVMKVVHYGNLVEYGCHIGHRLGVKTMILQKSDVIEKSISNAVCQTEELLDLFDGERPQSSASVEALNSEVSRRRKDLATLKEILKRC